LRPTTLRPTTLRPNTLCPNKNQLILLNIVSIVDSVQKTSDGRVNVPLCIYCYYATLTFKRTVCVLVRLALVDVTHKCHLPFIWIVKIPKINFQLRVYLGT
jgi:hypothetical protein